MSEGHMSLMTVRYQHTSGYSLGLDNIPDETDFHVIRWPNREALSSDAFAFLEPLLANERFCSTCCQYSGKRVSRTRRCESWCCELASTGRRHYADHGRGLDNAGKTTIVKKIMNEDVNSVSPTLGFIIKTIDYDGW